MNQSDEEAVSEIKRAEELRCLTYAERDWEALASCLGDDFTYTHGNGQLDNKAEYLEFVQRGPRRYVTRGEVTFRIYGDFAITNGPLTMSFDPGPDGSPSPSHEYDVMHVWARRDGRWLLIAHHGVIPAAFALLSWKSAKGSK